MHHHQQPHDPISEAVTAYSQILTEHRGELHIHLAPGFADAFVDPGEGEEPVMVRSPHGPHDDQRVRAAALAAYTRAGAPGPELRVKVELAAGRYDAEVPRVVVATPPEGFAQRLLRHSRWRHAQDRLRSSAWVMAPLLACALVCLLAFPFVSETTDNDTSLYILAGMPLLLPWVGPLMMLANFKALGVTVGTATMEKRSVDGLLKTASLSASLGRRTALTWVAWMGVYGAAVGGVATVGTFAAFSSEDWTGSGGPEEGSLLAVSVAGMFATSIVLATVFTYLTALLLGVFAQTVVSGNDEMFESRTQRTATRFILSVAPFSLVVGVLHAEVYVDDRSGSRSPGRGFNNIVGDWRRGPAEEVSSVLVGAYWTSILVFLTLTTLGVVFAVRHRRQRATRTAPARTWSQDQTQEPAH